MANESEASLEEKNASESIEHLATKFDDLTIKISKSSSENPQEGSRNFESNDNGPSSTSSTLSTSTSSPSSIISSKTSKTIGSTTVSSTSNVNQTKNNQQISSTTVTNTKNTSHSNDIHVTKVSVSSSHYDAIKSVNSSASASNSLKFGLPVPNRIFVGGIPPDVTDHELRKLFSQFGVVISTKIILDRAGVSRGYGFITFDKEIDAQKAISESNNLILNSRKLNVSPAVIKQGNQYSFDARLFSAEIYNYPNSFPASAYPGQITQAPPPLPPQHVVSGNGNVNNSSGTTSTTVPPSAAHLYGTATPYPGTFCSADGYLYQLSTGSAGPNGPVTTHHPLNGLPPSGQTPYLTSVGITHGPGTLSALTAAAANQTAYITSTGQASQVYAGAYATQYPPHPSYIYTNPTNSSLISNSQTNVMQTQANPSVSASVSNLYSLPQQQQQQQQPQQQQTQPTQYSITTAQTQLPVSAYQYPAIGSVTNAAITKCYLNTHPIINGGSTYYPPYGTAPGQQYSLDPIHHSGTLITSGTTNPGTLTAVPQHHSVHSSGIVGHTAGIDVTSYVHPHVHPQGAPGSQNYSTTNPYSNTNTSQTGNAYKNVDCEMDSSMNNQFDLMIIPQNSHSIGHITHSHGQQQQHHQQPHHHHQQQQQHQALHSTQIYNQQQSNQTSQQHAAISHQFYASHHPSLSTLSHHQNNTTSNQQQSQASTVPPLQPPPLSAIAGTGAAVAAAPLPQQSQSNSQAYYPFKYQKSTLQPIIPLQNSQTKSYQNGISTTTNIPPPTTGNNGQYHKDKSSSTTSSTSSRYNLSSTSGYSTPSNTSGPKGKNFNNTNNNNNNNSISGYNNSNLKSKNNFANSQQNYHHNNSSSSNNNGHNHTNNNYSHYNNSKEEINSKKLNNSLNSSSNTLNANLVTKTVNGIQLYAIDTAKNNHTLQDDTTTGSKNKNTNNNINNSDAIGKQSEL